jgi:hypothetical protein
VGSTVSVRVTGGKAVGVRWERCAVPVRAGRCARAVRIGSGRSVVLPSTSSGASIRAVMKVKGRTVRTRFSRPVAAASAAPAAPAAQLVVPPSWRFTGSASTIPFAAGTSQAQKDAVIAQLNVAYAGIDAQVRGGRTLFSSESLGNAGLVTDITVNLCTSGNAFTRRVAQAGLGGGGTSTVSGTWAITLDLTAGVVPALVLTDTAGTPLREDIDLVDASRVTLGSRTYTTGPSSTCG